MLRATRCDPAGLRVNQTPHPQSTRGRFDPLQRGATPFRVIAREWLFSKHDVKDSTRRGYEALLRPRIAQTPTFELSIDAVFGPVAIGSITRPQISAWVSDLVRSGGHPPTVRHAF